VFDCSSGRDVRVCLHSKRMVIMRLSTVTLSVLAAGMLAFAAPAANAQVLSYSEDATPILSTLTDFHLTMPVNKFDSSLGTLLSVKLDLSASLTSDITVKNNSPSASNGDVHTQLFAWLADPLAIFPDPAVTGSGSPVPGAFLAELNTPDQFYTLASGGSVSFLGQTASNSTSLTFTNPSLLAEFTGTPTGTINLIGATQARTRLEDSGGNTTATQTTSANMNARVTYTYSVVTIPEPASVSLIGFSLTAGGIAFRRRRCRA